MDDKGSRRTQVREGMNPSPTFWTLGLRAKGKESCALCSILLVASRSAIHFIFVLFVAALLISATGAFGSPTARKEAEEGIDRADLALGQPSTGIPESRHSAEQDRDPRIPYLLMGERMFRSRKLKEARETFEKLLELDSQDPQAHYFLGLIEYEEGNMEKAKTRFQIAHECLSSSLGTLQPSIPTAGDKHLQLEFPDEYKARIYYKDGWYVKSKDPSADRAVHSLEAGSTYRIELRPRHKESWVRAGMIGLIVGVSFFLAR